MLNGKVYKIFIYNFFFCIVFLQAYKRQSNSVKIAKITAFTIIVSSFILGAFILASSYLQAKASCDQVQALDSVLEKELMLETLQQVNKVSYIMDKKEI